MALTTSHSHDGPVTRNEELVLGALRRAEVPLTAYQLFDTLRSEGLKEPPQIYRALRSLGSWHLVHRLDSLNAFVACAQHHGHDARALVFAICGCCGRVEDEFMDERLDDRVRALAETRDFQIADAATELRGLCVACRGVGDTKADRSASAIV